MKHERPSAQQSTPSIPFHSSSSQDELDIGLRGGGWGSHACARRASRTVKARSRSTTSCSRSSRSRSRASSSRSRAARRRSWAAVACARAPMASSLDCVTVGVSVLISHTETDGWFTKGQDPTQNTRSLYRLTHIADDAGAFLGSDHVRSLRNRFRQNQPNRLPSRYFITFLNKPT